MDLDKPIAIALFALSLYGCGPDVGADVDRVRCDCTSAVRSPTDKLAERTSLKCGHVAEEAHGAFAPSPDHKSLQMRSLTHRTLSQFVDAPARTHGAAGASRPDQPCASVGITPPRKDVKNR